MSFLVEEKVSHSRTQTFKTVLTIKNVPFTWEKYHSTKEEYADLHDTVRRRKERKKYVRSWKHSSTPKEVVKQDVLARESIEKVNLTFSIDWCKGFYVSQPLATTISMLWQISGLQRRWCGARLLQTVYAMGGTQSPRGPKGRTNTQNAWNGGKRNGEHAWPDSVGKKMGNWK